MYRGLPLVRKRCSNTSVVTPTITKVNYKVALILLIVSSKKQLKQQIIIKNSDFALRLALL